MRKLIVLILSGVLLQVILTGCGAVRIQGGNENIETEISQRIEVTEIDKENRSVQEQKEPVIDGVTLPDQYFVSYEVADKDGVIKTISKSVDSQGNIYYENDQEYLFLLEGSNYILYQRENGTFVKKGDEKYRSDYVEELTKDFKEYVKKADLISGKSLYYVGENIIAGRNCDVYEISIVFVNFEQKFQYSIDKESNICLELKSEKNISGFEKAGDESFVCIRYDVEQIDLRTEFMGK